MKKRRAGGRRTKAEKKRQRNIALVLVGVLLVMLVTAVLVAVPDALGWLQRLLGIQQALVPRPGGLDGPVGVHVIDVGQGDAVLLEDNGAFALIDAGTPECEGELLAYLQDAGVQRLEYVFMSHPHADHIGSMQAVLEAYPVGLVVLPNFDLAPLPTTRTLESLLEMMVETQQAAETAALQAVYPLGEGEITVVHAGVETDDDYNLISLGLLYEGGGLRFLNTGDAERVNERAMLDSGMDVAANVFLASHHGSSTSNTSAFVRAVAPQVVVVSCAAGNSYGHPHRSALDAFAEEEALVLRTDREGCILLRPDGAGGLAYATTRQARQAAEKAALPAAG